jgi:hypothetical protein
MHNATGEGFRLIGKGNRTLSGWSRSARRNRCRDMVPGDTLSSMAAPASPTTRGRIAHEPQSTLSMRQEDSHDRSILRKNVSFVEEKTVNVIQALTQQARCPVPRALCPVS